MGLRMADGSSLSQQALLDELGQADLVCVGEQHSSPEHHFAQLAVLEALLTRAPAAGRQLGLGLEAFQRFSQGALDAYTDGDIDETALLERSEYAARWGFDFSLYRPLLERARSAGLSLVALNAPRELTRKIARSGLDALSVAERRELPRLDLGDSAHRAAFDAMMREHPSNGLDLDRFYAAQVVWDETMAETAARWLSSSDGRARQLLVAAGLGHCHGSAIASRVRRRAALAVVSVRPVVLDSAPTDDRALLAAAKVDVDDHLSVDYSLMLLPPPAGRSANAGGTVATSDATR